MEICRLCLNQEKNLISLLNNEEITNKIKECVSIEINFDDELPTTVCLSCLQKIEDWCSFKRDCLKSNKVLLNWARKNENNIFTESDCEDIKYILILDEKHELPENTYTCDICLEKFNTCLDYLDHQSIHNGAPVFKCDKCEMIFSSRDELVVHDRNHKQPCPECGKMILKNSMKLHLIKHTDRHMCAQCTSRFSSKSTLEQHIITIHTSRKDHICELCGKRFPSKTAMNVHIRSHSNERQYKCKVCDYAGRTSSAVYVHMSTHSTDICVCEVCSKIFKSTKNLNDHLRRVHRKEKKHQCGFCDKKFTDKYRLNVHVRCHTGIRPYICNLCDKAFIRSDGLKQHLAIHGDRIFHVCDKCGRKFASKKSVTRHQCTISTNYN